MKIQIPRADFIDQVLHECAETGSFPKLKFDSCNKIQHAEGVDLNEKGFKYLGRGRYFIKKNDLLVLRFSEILECWLARDMLESERRAIMQYNGTSKKRTRQTTRSSNKRQRFTDTKKAPRHIEEITDTGNFCISTKLD